MSRLIPCAPFLMVCLSGCFSEPSGSGSGNGSTGGGATDPTAPTSTGSETTAVSGTTSTGSSSSSGGTTADASTAAGESSSTGEPEGLCGCPEEPYVLCERFEEFEKRGEVQFKGWNNPGGEAAQQVTGPCGQAFRGEIISGQQSTVITYPLLDVLADDPSAVRVRGLMRLEPGCAEDTVHRLFSARFDFGPLANQLAYVADIEFEAGAMQIVQRTYVPAGTQATDIDTPPLGEWVRFELSVTNLDGKQPGLEARVGDDFVSVDRINPLDSDPVALTPVPGPFAFFSAPDAGCAVNFDNISVELLEAGL